MSGFIVWLGLLLGGCSKGQVMVAGECWDEIKTEQYLDLGDGKIKTREMPPGILYPKPRCPEGYQYNSLSTTTFYYEHCVKPRSWK
jgi:hypothetical protein